MGRYWTAQEGKKDRFGEAVVEVHAGKIVFDAVALLVVVIGSLMAGCPAYNVWQQAMSGKAKLAEAEYSRQIAVAEANAVFESSKLKAQARVEMAKGEAEANKILGDSLKNNEAYLRYLWIEQLEKGNQVIYVPTEANLPILEAGRALPVAKP